MKIIKLPGFLRRYLYIIIPIFFVLFLAGYFYSNSVGADSLTFVVSPSILTGDECVNAGASAPNKCFTRIQDAINEAAFTPGQQDRIQIQTGSGETSHIFKENLEILPGNEVVLIGIGGTNVIIIDGENKSALDIQSENVIIDSLTFQSSSIDSPTIYVRPPSSAAKGKQIKIVNSVIKNDLADSLYVADQYCTTCSNRIIIQNNDLYIADKRVSFYMQYVSGAIIENNNFISLSGGYNSKAIVVQNSQNITIRNNKINGLRGDSPQDPAYGVALITSFVGDDQNISITGNTFTNINGFYSSAIGINDLSSTSNITSVTIESNIFDSSVDFALSSKDTSCVAPELQIDLTNNTFTGVTSPQGREDKISHNCDKAATLYPGHQNLVCNQQDNQDENAFLVVKHTNVAVPVFLGWNKIVESAIPNETPVDIKYDPKENTVTKENNIAFVWGQVAGAELMKYQIDLINPNNSSIIINTDSASTDFINFQNINGEWRGRARAYIDANNNNQLDTSEDFSDWSSFTVITYDNMAPIYTPLSNMVLNEGDSIQTLQLNVSDESSLGKLCYSVNSETSSGSEICINGSGDNFTFNIWPEFSGTVDTAKWDEGTWTINYYAEDLLENRTATSTTTITINNVSPVVSLTSNTTTIKEGETINFNAAFSDPGLDDASWSVEFDYGDGQIGRFNTLTPGNISTSLTNNPHTYISAGTYTSKLTVTEGSGKGEGQSSTSELSIIVEDNQPEVTINIVPSEAVSGGVLEGTEIILTANVVNGNSPFIYDWLGDCNSFGSEPVIHINFRNGEYNCSLRVEDNDNDEAYSQNEISFTVLDNSPQVNINPGTVNVNEGSTFSLNAQVIGGNAPFTYNWIGTCAGTSSGPEVQLTLWNGTYNCSLEVIDGDGDSANSNTVTIQVNNIAPNVSISASPSTTVYAGTAALLTAIASGGNTPYTYLWKGACDTTAIFSYAPYWTGNHTCYVEVTDVDGDKSSSSVTINVIANPVNNTNPTPTPTPTPTKVAQVNPVLGEETTGSGATNLNNDDLDTNETLTKPISDTVDLYNCTKKIKVSGYVFYDTNKNNLKDQNDKGAPNIFVDISLKTNLTNKPLSQIKTDINGYWKFEVCSVSETLVIQIDKDTIPSHQNITSKEIINLNIGQNKDLANNNFILSTNGTYLLGLPLYSFCIIGPFLLGLMIFLFFYYRKRKKDKDEEKRKSQIA